MCTEFYLRRFFLLDLILVVFRRLADAKILHRYHLHDLKSRSHALHRLSEPMNKPMFWYATLATLI